MTTVAQILEIMKRDRTQFEDSIIACTVLILAAVLAITSTRRLQPLQQQAAALHATTATLSSFQGSFQRPSEAERQLWSSSADINDLGVPAGTRLSLVQTVARSADSVGLTDVRVRFAPIDSLYIPPRGASPEAALNPSKYTLLIDCQGGFAALLTFVNTLPAAVSVVRLDGVRVKTTTHYHITLAVYETTNASQSG